MLDQTLNEFHVIFSRFMESEIELNEIIQEMHVIATVPELYHILVDLNTVQSLLQLLSHENTDILYFNVIIKSDIFFITLKHVNLYCCVKKNSLTRADLDFEYVEIY